MLPCSGSSRRSANQRATSSSACSKAGSIPAGTLTVFSVNRFPAPSLRPFASLRVGRLAELVEHRAELDAGERRDPARRPFPAEHRAHVAVVLPLVAGRTDGEV